MSGPTDNVKSMWTSMRRYLDLEDPVPASGNTYLGCTQHDTFIPEADVLAKTHLFNRLLTPKAGKSQDAEKDEAANAGDIELLPPIAKPQKKAKAKKKPKAPEGGASEKSGAANGARDHAQSGAGQPSARALSLSPKLNSRQPDNGGSHDSTSASKSVRAWKYEMCGHARQCVDRYLELSGKTEKDPKTVATPCMDDHQFDPQEFITKGHLSHVASRIVLKCLYLARAGRPDLLWTVNYLARKVTKWNATCDRRLLRLISYINTTQDWCQSCFVGDKPEKCWLALFSDASFAGDLEDSKSTSGSYLCLVGLRTFVPLSWMCKKQTAVSHSSSEAEIIALDAALRLEGIPALMLWDLVLEVYSPAKANSRRTTGEGQPTRGRQASQSPESVLSEIDAVPPTFPNSSGRGRLVIFEDNDAVIKMIIKGRAPTLRHVPRTHKVDLDWLFERMRDDPGIFLKYVGTKEQIADIFTKGNFSKDAWLSLCRLAQIGPPPGSMRPQSITTDVAAIGLDAAVDRFCGGDHVVLCAQVRPCARKTKINKKHRYTGLEPVPPKGMQSRIFTLTKSQFPRKGCNAAKKVLHKWGTCW